jgi:hypothetical protein
VGGGYLDLSDVPKINDRLEETYPRPISDISSHQDRIQAETWEEWNLRFPVVQAISICQNAAELPKSRKIEPDKTCMKT